MDFEHELSSDESEEDEEGEADEDVDVVDVCDVEQGAVVLILEEDVLGGEQDHLVLLLAHREEQLHVDLIQTTLLQLPTTILHSRHHLLRLTHPQLLQTVVLLHLVHLHLVVAKPHHLSLTDADLRLELGEVFLSTDPMIQFADGIEGGHLLDRDELRVELKRGLEVVGEEDLDIGEVEQFALVEDVLLLPIVLHNGALPLEVILVIVVLKEVLVLLQDVGAKPRVLGNHGHEGD